MRTFKKDFKGKAKKRLGIWKFMGLNFDNDPSTADAVTLVAKSWIRGRRIDKDLKEYEALLDHPTGASDNTTITKQAKKTSITWVDQFIEEVLIGISSALFTVILGLLQIAIFLIVSCLLIFGLYALIVYVL